MAIAMTEEATENKNENKNKMKTKKKRFHIKLQKLLKI